MSTSIAGREDAGLGLPPERVQPDSAADPGGSAHRPLRLAALSRFHRAYWALVPILTVAAYVTVLRIGFLSEDMGLNRIAQAELGWQAALPNAGLRFYRPLGFLLTWRLNWPLWGLNPFPYHLEGLLLHAAVALVLGLWIADITSQRSLGWLTGALFGVFPLNTEAVGWLATQWDLWAALFGVGGVWLFSRWWRGDGGRLLYAGSLSLFTLGIFTKESVFAFIAVIGASAWYVLPPRTLKRWLLLATALLPFAAALTLNLGIREVVWGGQHNYSDISNDYLLFFWDQAVEHLRPVLAPILPVIFGERAVQAVAALSALGLLTGLVVYGRGVARLLLVAGVWLAVSLAPVLNLGIPRPDLQNSRLLYLATAGYCIAVAALLWSAVSQARRLRVPLLGAIGLLIFAGVAVTWVQLRPWHTATVQAQEVENELARLIPLQARPQRMVWYLENVPERYKGAWVLRSAISRTRYTPDGGSDIPDVVRVLQATEALVGSDRRDAFALRWLYDEAALRWHIDYGVGVTQGGEPPSAGKEDAGSALQVWDFRGCVESALAAWQPNAADSRCEQSRGLILNPTGDGPQLTGPPVSINPAAQAGRFVRLRVAVRYHPAGVEGKSLMRWLWRQPGATNWDDAKSRALPIKMDDETHIYWAFLTPADLQGAVARLRLDLSTAVMPAEVRWIAVDIVQ